MEENVSGCFFSEHGVQISIGLLALASLGSLYCRVQPQKIPNWNAPKFLHSKIVELRCT